MSSSSTFDERKASQAAAYLLFRAGGRLPLLKLMKLLYLSERVSFQRFGDSITGDAMVSMPHGPVLSMTYDHLNGGLESMEGGWSTWISDRAGNEVALQDSSMIRSPEEDLLALSDNDLECLAQVWSEFGHWDRWKLVEYTHTGGCPEWEDPKGSSRPIPPARLLKALGHAPAQVEALSRRLHQQRLIHSAFR
jgi:uncharacterized phage-associated protein